MFYYINHTRKIKFVYSIIIKLLVLKPHNYFRLWSKQNTQLLGPRLFSHPTHSLLYCNHLNINFIPIKYAVSAYQLSRYLGTTVMPVFTFQCPLNQIKIVK